MQNKEGVIIPKEIRNMSYMRLRKKKKKKKKLLSKAERRAVVRI